MGSALSRERAVELLAASESEIRALGVARLALFGSVCAAMPILTATWTSWYSFPRAPKHSIVFLRFPNFSKSVPGAA